MRLSNMMLFLSCAACNRAWDPKIHDETEDLRIEAYDDGWRGAYVSSTGVAMTFEWIRDASAGRLIVHADDETIVDIRATGEDGVSHDSEYGGILVHAVEEEDADAIRALGSFQSSDQAEALRELASRVVEGSTEELAVLFEGFHHAELDRSCWSSYKQNLRECNAEPFLLRYPCIVSAAAEYLGCVNPL